MTTRIDEIFLEEAEVRLGKPKTLRDLSDAWRHYEENLSLLDEATLGKLEAIRRAAVLRVTGGGIG